MCLTIQPSNQRVVTLVDIFFFITNVKLLSDCFYSLSPRMLQTFVCVKGFTYAEKKLHYRWWILFPAILNSNFVNWKLSHALALNQHLRPRYSWGKDFKHKNSMYVLYAKTAKNIDYLKYIVASLREKCPNTEFFLVRIFPHSHWIQRDTPYLSVSSQNARKYGPEKTP